MIQKLVVISLKHHVRDELEPQVLLFCFEITRRLTKVWNFLKLLPYKRINLSCIHNREWRTDSWDFSHNPDYEMAMSTSDTLSALQCVKNYTFKWSETIVLCNGIILCTSWHELFVMNFYRTQVALGSDLWVLMSVRPYKKFCRLNWCDSGWWG